MNSALTIGRDFKSPYAIDHTHLLSIGTLLRDEAVKVAMERLAAETERWCQKAMDRGIGNRVWRSNPIAEPWPSTVTRYQFRILAQGEGPPGSGLVYGPW